MMALARVAVAALSLASCIDATPLAKPFDTHMLRKKPGLEVQSRRVTPFAPATPLRKSKAEYVMPFKRAKKNAGASAFKNIVGDVSSVPIDTIESGAAYAIDIDFGGETFNVIFDTGSSDLWLPASNVNCFNAYAEPVPVAQCEFGPTFDGNLTGGIISNLNFNITYGDGEFLTGRMGYEDVCIGGIQVVRQQVALVDYAYWFGDGVASGLVGFAYPALTSAFRGNDPSLDNRNISALYYNNWIFNAIERELVSPMFSLALERQDSGTVGQLTLGGVPDVEIQNNYTSTPLEIMQLTNNPIQASNFTYYTIVPDGFVVGNRSLPSSFPVIVDSGTTLAYLPMTLTRQIAQAFQPAATYLPLYGLYETDCNATIPDIAVTIGGTRFRIAKEDLLLTGDLGYDNDTGMCLLGIQPIDDVYILGDTFMKNVVSVFDIGASEMRFAQRA